MKKYIGLLLLICSFAIFGANEKEGLNFEITPKINFFMKRQDFEKSIQRKPESGQVLNTGAVFEYSNVTDLIGQVYQTGSFLFFEDSLFSSIFKTPTTLEKHKKILNSYINFFKNTPKSNLTKLENKKANAILYYNDKILLFVYYKNNLTTVIIQLTDEEFRNARINELNSL